MKLINGAVYKHNYRTFTIIFINHDQWGMLQIERHCEKGMSAPMFQYDKSGKYIFTEQELIHNFDMEDWVKMDGRLRIEKIDDMSLTEYPNGKLEEL